MTQQLPEYPLTSCSGSAQKIIGTLLGSSYPALFRQLESIASALSLFDGEDQKPRLQLLLDGIRHDLSNMCVYEQEELFPQLLALEQEDGKLPSCQPIKNILPFYKSARRQLLSLRLSLADIKDNNFPRADITAINCCLETFESELQALHTAKEKQLFNPRRNCRNCKSPL